MSFLAPMAFADARRTSPSCGSSTDLWIVRTTLRFSTPYRPQQLARSGEIRLMLRHRLVRARERGRERVVVADAPVTAEQGA
jgi:hypothetical protein